MRKPGFSEVLITWFCICMILALINAYTLKTGLLYGLCTAGLGIYLFLRPVWPGALRVYYSEEKCRLFIRILSIGLILFSALRLFPLIAAM